MLSAIKHYQRCLKYGLLALILTASSMAVYVPKTVRAVTAADWQAGRIIDDAVFSNKDAMSAADIQNFLNAKVPNCDTNGTQATTHWNSGANRYYTRAEWGAIYGNPAPFTCLRDYYEVPKTQPSNGMPANNYGGKPIPAGAISAAQMIWNAAQSNNISPKVLLTTIQKESAGPLTVDDWPWANQYTYAMGAHCPDTSPCDPNYAGFSIQISESARLFRYYLDNMSQPWWPYKKPGVNSILYNPSSSCGASDVNIQSMATAALYTYTPYQPNQAALNNMYGTGDNCSAYGNRNFWRIFNDWFGSSLLSNLPGCNEATNTARSCVWSLYAPQNLSQYLTSSVQTRDYLFTSRGYQYAGKVFFGNVIPLTGNMAVYRASIDGGGSFLTTNQNEYNQLVAGGYTGNGIDFYADPPWSNSGYPVYRLYNPATYQHYWTANSQQRQSFLQSGYNDEGVAFTSISPVRQEVAPPQGKLLVYRFYIPQTYSHFWTTDINERDNMINAGYSYEGVAWYSASDTTAAPVYRLYAPSINQHLYTADLNEKNNLVTSGSWNYEGISQYVSMVSTSRAIYRLYAPSLGVHLYTADANERGQLLASGHWNSEGIAWYQP